ncbi:MAG: O-antigen ligase family protein [Oscillospiraceae bacterium]
MTEQENQIWEKIQKENQRKTQAKVLSIMAKILLCFILGLFMISPFLQLIIRMTLPEKYHYMILSSTSIQVVKYQQMIRRVNQMARFVAAFFYIYCGYYLITNRKTVRANLKQYLKRIAPLVLFFLLALTILIVTKIRGANEYDLTGHPYMYESIYSYITYPLVYFFCGMFVSSSGMKRGLLYTLLISAIPLNILSLVNEWITPVKYYIGGGKAYAVFHNSNRYGYYLVLVILSSAILFVYEKKLGWKIFNALSAILGTVVLIVNDTLGSYLAVLLVLIFFVIYCMKKDREYFWLAVGAFGGFMLITLIMGLWYDTVTSSFTKLFIDLGSIIEDPLEADSAGSSRWRLWKGTVQHMGESPLLGFGVEGLLNTYGIGTPHNELLQYAEFFGIPVMLLYVATVTVIIVTIMKNSTKFSKTTLVCFCASVGYLISSFFGVQIYYTTPFIYIFLGLTYAEYFRGIEESSH